MELLGHPLTAPLPLPCLHAADWRQPGAATRQHLGLQQAVTPLLQPFKALVFITLSLPVFKGQQKQFGEQVGRKKKLVQRCEENFLPVKDILCTAHGSRHGVLFTAPASRTYYTAGSSATIRVQLIT